MSAYTVPFDNLSVTNDADQDIFELTAPSDAAIKIIGFELYSATTTDERVRLRLVRRSTAGSGGAGSVEVPTSGTLAAVGAAVTQLNTAPGTIGDILLAWYWSQLSPLTYAPVPEGMIVVPPSGRIALNLQTAVASTRNWSGWLKFAELG